MSLELEQLQYSIFNLNLVKLLQSLQLGPGNSIVNYKNFSKVIVILTEFVGVNGEFTINFMDGFEFRNCKLDVNVMFNFVMILIFHGGLFQSLLDKFRFQNDVKVIKKNSI